MQLFIFAAAFLVTPAFGEPIPQTSKVNPSSKPYIPEYNISDICFPGQKEECQGSSVYCLKSGWKAKGEPKQYKNASECLRERTSHGSPNASPGSKILYLEAQGTDCFNSGSEEICTGSAVFCAKSENPGACLAARTSPPKNLPFQEGGSCPLLTERCIGTVAWCRMSGAEEQKCLQRRTGSAKEV